MTATVIPMSEKQIDALPNLCADFGLLTALTFAITARNVTNIQIKLKKHPFIRVRKKQL